MNAFTSWLLIMDRNILYRHTGSSFGTIDRTLQHIVSGQMYWHDILVKGQINAFNQPVRENAVEKTIDDRVTSSQQLVNDLKTLTEQQLMERIRVSDSTQSRYEYPIRNSRIFFLLIASLFFYSWGEPRLFFVMIISILSNYISGMLMNYTRTLNREGLTRLTLFVAICINLGMLLYYKYSIF